MPKATPGPWKAERVNAGAEHPLFVTADGKRGEHRGDPHYQGLSDGADEVACAIRQRFNLDNPSGPCADAQGEHGATEQVAGGSTPGTFDMRILRPIDEGAEAARKLAMYADEAKPKLTNELLETARNHEWTEEEKRKQVESVAYGNLKLDGCEVTREGVAEAYDKLQAEPKEGSNG